MKNALIGTAGVLYLLCVYFVFSSEIFVRENRDHIEAPIKNILGPLVVWMSKMYLTEGT